ncbi:MAG: hypothetical protein ACYTGP_13100 [Planctomycetota bacterium]|jgi:hypothetical protein
MTRITRRNLALLGLMAATIVTIGRLAEASSPTCPPSGPTRVQAYLLTGTATDTPWSWHLRSTTDAFDPLEEFAAPGVPAGESALSIAQAFADRINAARDARGCTSGQIDAQAAELLGLAYLVISTGGGSEIELLVGAAGADPDCVVAAGLFACSFNPTIEEVSFSGEDCDANGEDDMIDLLIGGGADENDNGVLDTCECTADLDGSGGVDFGDLLSIIAAWGPCDACPEDLSANGIVDFADILEVLGTWGPCL